MAKALIFTRGHGPSGCPTTATAAVGSRRLSTGPGAALRASAAAPPRWSRAAIALALILLAVASLPAPAVVESRALRPANRPRPVALLGPFVIPSHPMTRRTSPSKWQPAITHISPSLATDHDTTSDPFDLANVDSVAAWAGRYSDLSWAIYCGSAQHVLQQLPSATINCIVTSPPYFWLRDYGVPDQLGLESTVAEYVTALTTALREARRLLTPNGLAFLNIGDTFYSGKGESQGHDGKSKKRRFGLRAVDKSGGLGIGLRRKSLIGIPWRVAIQLVSDGWVLRSSVIWHRKNRLPESVRDRPSRSYEYVFILAKSRRYYFNKKALLSRHIEEDMWTIPAQPRPTNGIDTAPFPDELVERCLAIGCPDAGVVLDPFVGSGTTVRVALSSGRSAIGIDLNREFCVYAANSLQSL